MGEAESDCCRLSLKTTEEHQEEEEDQEEGGESTTSWAAVKLISMDASVVDIKSELDDIQWLKKERTSQKAFLRKDVFVVFSPRLMMCI